jgi:succinate dehydrogenase / fumarate reductase flavoprotein subunit
MIKHDVLIIGGGLAGLRAGIEMCRSLDAGLISRVHPLRSHSGAAQGGINASLANHPAGTDDHAERHAFDTVRGADYLADQHAVRLMCEQAPRAVYEMEHWGTPFSRFDDGRIAQRPFGGAGFPRACYASDRTGLTLLHTLYEQAIARGLEMYEEWLVVRLVARDGRVCGLVALHIPTGRLEGFMARAILFATGGYGQVFASSDNALINTGLGIGVAYRAGAAVKDLEFVQFHPTTLSGSHILVTEGARGEGGYLLNRLGHRFMEHYAPKAMELAPRDIVARAMRSEIAAGRGFEDRYLHLDLRHLGRRCIKQRLPGIRQLAIDFSGIDPIENPIPVVPSQHYSMGGIDVDVNGASEIGGLFAAGECACVSVHGANRLGGNSLLEAIVYGRVAGASARDYAGATATPPGADQAMNDALKEEDDRIRRLTGGRGRRVYPLRERIREIMDDQVGIFRDARSLREACEKIRGIREQAAEIRVPHASRRWNQELTDALDFSAFVDLAEVVASSAARRTESRGSHFRTDFPGRDDAGWLRHTIAHWEPEGPVMADKEVTITEYEPRERTY